MSLRTRLTDSLKKAMLAKDQRTVATLRMAQAAVKDADINARPAKMDGISEAEILALFQKLVKQRRDSIELYKQGGRADLAQQEAEEIAVLEQFMPKAMSPDEAQKAIGDLIAEMGASGMKDMGKVMNELRTRYAGQMDFGQASVWIKEKLAGK